MSAEMSMGKPAPSAPRRRRPALELLMRYGNIFRAAWQQREALAGPQRLADEAAFLPAALSLQDTPVHPAPRRLAWTLSLLFLLAWAWSVFGRVDIVAVAPGRIIVSERTKLVQPLEASVVKRVLVRDGDRVQAGQPLVELDPTSATADRTSIDDQLQSAQSEVLRTRLLLQALHQPTRGPALGHDLPPGWTQGELAAASAQLADEWRDITAKLARADAEIQRRRAEIATAREIAAKLEATVPLARQREADLRPLADDGFIPRHSMQDRTRERLVLERDLAIQKARSLEATAVLRESEHTRSAYLAETMHSLRAREAAAELKRQQMVHEQAKASQRERLTRLLAPVAGTVQQLAIHTEGGVVTAAQPVMVIVPEGAPLTAEVMLDNKDIGFVQVGQRAEIKFETFPFTRYGTVAATISRVSADAVNDEKRGAVFPVTLLMNAATIDIDGKPIRLSPGMNLTAEIKTGRRRVIEFLFSPLQRAGSESLRER